MEVSFFLAVVKGNVSYKHVPFPDLQYFPFDGMSSQTNSMIYNNLANLVIKQILGGVLLWYKAYLFLTGNNYKNF